MPVPIVNSVDSENLVYRYDEQTVADHEKAWGFLLDATTGAPFEERLLACNPRGSMVDHRRMASFHHGQREGVAYTPAWGGNTNTPPETEPREQKQVAIK